MRKVTVFTVLLVVCLSFPLGAEQLSRREYGVLEKAYLLLEKAYYRDCLELLQPLLANEKPSSYAFSYAAACHGSLSEISQARTLLARAVQLYPKQSGLWYNLGIYQMQLEDFAGAVTSYRKIIQIDGDKVGRDIYYHLGFGLYRLGKYRKAADTVGRITMESPKRHWLQLEAYCYMELEEWLSAERVALRIVALDPLKADGWNLLASIRMNMEEYSSVTASLEVAGLLAPERAQHRVMSSLYGAQSAWNEQVLHFEELDEEPYQHARRLNASSRFQDALEKLNRKNGLEMESALLKGTLLFSAGRRGEAVDCLVAVEQLPCTYMALSAKKRDSKQEQRRYRDRLRGRALLLAGQILWLDHEWQRARDVFKRLELLPGYGEVGKSLASCMQMLLEEKGRVLELPDVFDPPMVVEAAGS